MMRKVSIQTNRTFRIKIRKYFRRGNWGERLFFLKSKAKKKAWSFKWGFPNRVLSD